MAMLIRTKLIGKGTDSDPWRVALPTYQHVHGNVTHGYAIVSVPDEVHGLTEADLVGETVEKTTEGDLYPALSNAALVKLHRHLDTRYSDHKGKFRVEVVS